MTQADRILAALPQTQCTRCGYPDCAHYAQAIEKGEAQINQCPPGGDEGVHRLSFITGQPYQPLNPENGVESPRHVVWIDEAWCIGCTLCLEACPVDAIVGTHKRMHTVIEQDCTGCELCLPVCPVDCIYEADDQYFIHPDECIDCGACEPECPVTAIFPDTEVPAEWTCYIEKNRANFA